MKTKFAAVIGSSLMLASLVVAAPAFAQGTTSGQSTGQHAWGGPSQGMPMRGQGAFGTVSAISGTTLTITSKGFGQNAQSTTYTVDASNATVMKNGATSTLSAVAVGDMIFAQGTVSGTNVTATMIRDGMPQGMPGKGGMGSPRGGHASSTPPFVPQGNGEPVVGGSVSAISGNTLTVAAKAGATYTVDASSAVVSDKGATSTVSAIAVGDNVIVQGAVNGSSVTASSVIDQGAAKAPQTGSGAGMGAKVGGFFGGIGSFIHKLFGFF